MADREQEGLMSSSNGHHPVHTGRRKMPRERAGKTTKVEITCAITGSVHEGYITANTDDEGVLREVFLEGFGKEGSTTDGWVHFSAILFSGLLQHEADFPHLVKKLAGMKFEPFGFTSHPQVRWCTSVPDFIVRWLALEFGSDELRAELALSYVEMKV